MIQSEIYTDEELAIWLEEDKLDETTAKKLARLKNSSTLG